MVDLHCPHCRAPYRFDPHIPVVIEEADAGRRLGPLVISQAEQVIHECSPTAEAEAQEPPSFLGFNPGGFLDI